MPPKTVYLPTLELSIGVGEVYILPAVRLAFSVGDLCFRSVQDNNTDADADAADGFFCLFLFSFLFSNAGNFGSVTEPP